MSKLALGTVQFGLDYGINNTRGRVPENEVSAILAFARESGIDMLDTAPAYGESEAVLGRVLGAERHFRIVSKLPLNHAGSAREVLLDSLKKLNRDSVYAYMLHNYEIYAKNPQILKELAESKKNGLVQKIGVSLYRPEEAEELLENNEELDIVQVPYNLLDRRFEAVFDKLKQRGTEIHVRSVFLQGLFFKDPATLSPIFDPVKKSLMELRDCGKKYNCSIASVCLGFAAGNPHVDRIVIGVDSLTDLQDNVAAFGNAEKTREMLVFLENMGTTDENILLPFNWNKK